jgi:hypothetical protein
LLQHDADDKQAWPKPMQQTLALHVWRTPQLDAAQSAAVAQPHRPLTQPAPGAQPPAVQSTQAPPEAPQAEAPPPLTHRPP